MLIGIDASRANKPYKTGTEWYSYHLIQELKKIDTENHYFLYTNKPLTGGLEKMPSDKWQEKLLGWPPIRLWTQIRLSWEMLRRPPDVLFVPAHALPLICPKRSVATVHDIGFERFPKLYKRVDIIYHRFVVRFALKHATKIITISNFTKQEMVDVYRADPGKIAITHLGYDQKKYRVINDKERIKKVSGKYVGDSKYILYIGRLEEKKNIVNLLKAFKSLSIVPAKDWSAPPRTAFDSNFSATSSWLSGTQARRGLETKANGNCLLLIVGKPGYGYPRIQATIKQLDLQDKIVIPGWVPEEDLPYLMNAAELFVFPSLYEGFGIPPLQAMACGCPVVASNAASIPEVIGEPQAGSGQNTAIFIDPHKPEDIAGAIQKMLAKPEIRENLIQKGLARARQFSWKKCAEETLKILKSI